MTDERRVFLRDLLRLLSSVMRYGAMAMALLPLTLCPQTKGETEKKNAPVLATESFDNTGIGNLPSGWMIAQTGAGQPQLAAGASRGELAETIGIVKAVQDFALH